jgi:predicted RNA binding protein YcfA (HicA-like mRNA interferase family)
MPRFGDLKRWLDREGWTLVRTTDHHYYRKVAPDGRVLFTKVSLALTKEIPPGLWRRILKRQLGIRPEDFH